MSAEWAVYETEPLRAEIDGLELLVREQDALIAALRAELKASKTRGGESAD